MLLFLFTTAVAAQESDPLSRAIEAIGGDAAIDKARAISVVMVGTQDLQVIAQGPATEKPGLRWHQETLLVDSANRRAVLRSDGMSADSSPTSWRFSAVGDEGFNVRLKTGAVSSLSKEATAALYERLIFSVPHLALAEMRAQRGQLKCAGTKALDARVHDVCTFKDRLTVLFDQRTRMLSAYEYEMPTLLGKRIGRYQFKDYVPSGAGLYPAGYRFFIGGVVFRELDMIDARPAVKLENHPWFVRPPESAKPAFSVPRAEPRTVEKLADGVWLLRNVGGYNVMFAQVQDCIAVFDAPATYGHQGSPIPNPSAPPDIGAQIVETITKETGKKICYAVPTHHHADHIGGIVALARAGAKILTTPGTLGFARSILTAAGVSGLNVESISDRRTLGTGDGRIDLWVIRNDPHAEEMLFAHLPARKIVFEGDLSDYVLTARHFRRFIEEKDLEVEKLYGAHSFSAYSLDDLQWEEPVN
jgi:hypothetical protein